MSAEETLAELVERFPLIWDKKNFQHSDKVAVENASETISEIMNFSVEECMESWKSLRLKYVRERRNLKCIPSGSGVYSCSWPLFEKMGFLDKTIITRRTKGNMSKISNQNKPSCDVWNSITDILSPDEESVPLLEEELEVAPSVTPEITPTVQKTVTEIGNLRKDRFIQKKNS